MQQRYPQGIYNRIWEGHIYSWTIITNTTNVDSLKGNNNAYNVPIEVLMTTLQSYNSSYDIKIYWTPSNSSNNQDVFLHLAELRVLQPGQVRRLNVYVNDYTFITTVTPEYLQPVTVPTLPFSGLSGELLNLLAISVKPLSVLQGHQIFHS